MKKITSPIQKQETLQNERAVWLNLWLSGIVSFDITRPFLHRSSLSAFGDQRSLRSDLLLITFHSSGGLFFIHLKIPS